MPKFRKLPLIEVEWMDTTTYTGWDSDKDDYSEEGLLCRSVGWQLKSSRNSIVITPMRNEDKRCNDRQIIPRACVVSIRKLQGEANG